MTNRPMARRALYVALALALALPLQAHAVRVDYAIDMGIERNDNILMSPVDPEDSDALRAGVGFVVSEETSAVQANASGRFEYWNYVSGPQTNTLETSLAGRLNWFFVPEVVSFTIEDSLEMRPVDRFAPDTQENRQRVNVLALGPNVHFNWSQAVRGRFELRWIDSSAERDDEFESERLSAALHAVRELDTTSSVSLSVDGEDVDFDNDLTGRDYRRYDSYLRYQKQLARLGFGIDAGYTWVDYADGDSASNPMLRVNAQWRFSERHTLSIGAARQLSDTATAAIDGIGETVTVPDQLTGMSSGIDSSIYKETHADISYGYQGERASFGFGPYYERVDYLDDTSFDETRRGAVARFTYRLASRWDLQSYADIARSRFPAIGVETEDLRVGLSLDRTWSRHWSSSIQYTHYRREDDGLLGNSHQNIWFLTISYRNR